ncbi:MAG: flagellar basal body P-ring protein FlgI [Oceanospirillaceae bacterium]|jgi:flagellar P-ring protein precursor FlgI|uniref:flagellar basal body P-ring protein FlgI n=1 Tax=Marinobacterium litorale TaxID=404770 RepID=UPI00041CDD64|nr:flagellar basal body P-ring protein FlgI [Marinobacterium litorale]MBS97797.1 flagellar basal body P-ring protein FlgI [Oceanospirillaceae bacterium]
MKQALICFLTAVLASAPVMADRLKDITSVAGVRSNQLVGYGLVVGLEGTGDGTDFTSKTFRNMLNNFGVAIPADIDPQSDNIAAVAIHANLPPFAKPGQTIDVTVSAIGDADSLRGGSLLMAPLKGADGQVYAIAQGNLVVSGFGAEGADGSRLSVNVPSVGRIPNGASVERAVPNAFSRGDSLVLNLNRSDFTTARRVAEQINGLLGPDVASALDATSIRVRAPRDSSQRVAFLSVLENLEVDPGMEQAKVVINSRTGTIIVGQNVKISPVAITHGGLTIAINENIDVNQPNALAEGETVITPRTGITVDENSGRMFEFAPGPTLSDIVEAVNQVGAAPGDLMAILEALKQAGALKAELVVI